MTSVLSFIVAWFIVALIAGLILGRMIKVGSQRCSICWGHSVDCHICGAGKGEPAR
jgi:hypothetical protein